MADVADSSTIVVDLGEGKQVVLIGGHEIYLQVWAYRGALGVALTVEQAKEIGKALLIAAESVDGQHDNG